MQLSDSVGTEQMDHETFYSLYNRWSYLKDEFINYYKLHYPLTNNPVTDTKTQE